VAYLDDVTVVGRPAVLQRVFDRLRGNGEGSLRRIGLKVRQDKSGVFGGQGMPRNQQPVAALAAALGVKHRREGFTLVGVPVGNPDYVRSELSSRAQKVCDLVSKCRALPLSKQTQFLLLRASLSARMVHLQRTVNWQHLGAATTRVEQAILSAVAELFRLPAAEGAGGLTPLPGKPVEQLLLPIGADGFGLRISCADGAEAAFLSGAASAQLVMKDAPQMFRPFDGPNRGAFEESWLRLFDDFATDCGWAQAVRGLNAQSETLLPVVQRDVARCLADRRAAALLRSCDCTTDAGKRDAARLRSGASATASAWLMATPGPTTRLGDETFVVCGRHRMGLGAPTTVDPPPCLCGAGCASTPDHAMLCKNVAKMTQMRHDIVVSAVRRVISRASCPSSLEPSYRPLQQPGALQGAGPGQRRGDIMAVLPGGQISMVDVVVTHPARQDCLGQACVRNGIAAQRSEDRKVREFRQFGDAGQYEFVPFALESYGRLGASAQNFLKRLGDIGAGRANISKSAFVKSAYREVSCALQRGIGLMYARSNMNIARASGRHFMPGCDVPVQDEALL
jgi:hypothetical protein